MSFCFWKSAVFWKDMLQISCGFLPTKMIKTPIQNSDICNKYFWIGSDPPSLIQQLSKNSSQLLWKVFPQIGIVSIGKGCADPRFPGIYTRVSSLMTWVKNITSGYTVWDSSCNKIQINIKKNWLARLFYFSLLEFCLVRVTSHVLQYEEHKNDFQNDRPVNTIFQMRISMRNLPIFRCASIS